MPNRDGTGPMGIGPLTGRGMGPCKGNNQNALPGRGRRNGFRGMNGYGYGFNPAGLVQPRQDELRKS